MNIKLWFEKVRRTPSLSFVAFGVIALILTLLGVGNYVALDLSSIWLLLGYLIMGGLVGGLLRIWEPGRDKFSDFINGAFSTANVLLVLYILQPLVISPLFQILGI